MGFQQSLPRQEFASVRYGADSGLEIPVMRDVAHGDYIRLGQVVPEEISSDPRYALFHACRSNALLRERHDRREIEAAHTLPRPMTMRRARHSLAGLTWSG
jgi:hypothetical protein